MSRTPGNFRYRLEADFDDLARMAEHFEKFARACEVPSIQVQRMTLAVDELVTNIIKYGIEAGKPAEIQVSATLAGDSIRIEIEHHGVPFDPFHEAPAPDTSLPLEQRPIGGLGVFLAQSLMTTTEYRRLGDRNLITLTRSLRPEEESQ